MSRCGETASDTPASRKRGKPPLATRGRGRAVRLAGYDYAGDWPVHLTMCAATGSPFADADVE